MKININADVGEGYGRWQLGDDAAVIPLVPSVNIACGFHAGDPTIMRRSVTTALEAGSDIGAHVSLPDLRGFGRRPMQVPPEDLRNDILYQIGALGAFVNAAGGRMRHVKPHGSLYAMCGREEQYARALLDAVAAYDPSLIVIVGHDRPQRLAGEYGLDVVYEGYIDLDYQADGFPWVEPVKLAREPSAVLERALRIVRDHAATALDGTELDVHTPTLCVHGDMPNAVEVAEHLREGLREAGVQLTGLADSLTAFGSASGPASGSAS